MRGRVYRRRQASLPVFVNAAIISAIFFGFMHGYPALLLGPVITIGALSSRSCASGGAASSVRWWPTRLNNATVLGLVIGAALRDPLTRGRPA